MIDDKHVVETYANNINIENFRKEGEIFFTKSEIKKVKKYLPSEKFVLIEPQNHKDIVERSYPFEKIQQIVNLYKNRINFVQISPSKFATKESRFLNNVKIYKDIFTYRETILFGKFAEFAIVPEGGLSNGLACVNLPTICTFPPRFNPRMTAYDSTIIIDIGNNNHDEFNKNLFNSNNDAIKLVRRHKIDQICEKIDLFLEKIKFNTKKFYNK